MGTSEKDGRSANPKQYFEI